MNNYLFFLGHQPHISTAEIEAVFSVQKIDHEIKNIEKNILFVSTKKILDPQKLIQILGGTVKISEQIDSADGAGNAIINFLQIIQPSGKIQFSLTGKNGKPLAMLIKKELKKSGRNVRYIEIKNTATILHNNLIEKQGDFTIFDENVFVSRAIQPIEDFTERDFGRPGTDSRSGMLPPKLAKIMINLGLPNTNHSLLDPFCGSGTVLTEAVILGLSKIYGTDISKKAIEDSIKNLSWIKENKKIKQLDYKLNVCDAAKLCSCFKIKDIDLIVSEPYMGIPLRGKETEHTLIKQANELKELYISAFKNFKELLKNNGIVIFIIPSFIHNNSKINIDCVEEIKKMGFSVFPFSNDQEFLSYYRPGQKLARHIWRFKRN